MAATSFRARILAWEDDVGSRCTYDASGFGGGDNCRTQMNTSRSFTNPNEFSYTSSTFTLGNSDYRMNVFYQYRYSTASLPDATEYAASSITTSGSRPFWGCKGNWALVGSDCAASGTITHNQTSSFSTTVSCKSMVNFRWRISSLANADYMFLYVNGVKKDSISGTVGWTTKSVALDTGANTVEWRYVKDGSISTGLDRGFVDFITFTNATSVNPGIISGSQLIVAGGSVSTLASVQPALGFSNTLSYQWQYSNGISWSNIGGANGSSYTPSSPSVTTFYRRSVATCGSVAYSNVDTLTVMPYVANTVATDTSVGYITSGSWHHFYNTDYEVIFSLQGNLTGATTSPKITVSKNAMTYVNPGTPSNCILGSSPGNASFEMERNWNVNFTGTLSGTYNVRFYYLQEEMDSVVSASYAHKNTYINCGYGNKYVSANGFYWFKTTASTYVAPTYDTTLVLAGSITNLSSTLRYAQLSGITSFSGGSGGIILSPVSFLPVDLIAFTCGLNKQNDAELKWSTGSELNNEGFYIERSLDNDYFREIGFVEGQGTSDTRSEYQFLDEDFVGTAAYYRLRQVDYDGSSSYSESIAIIQSSNGAVVVGRPIPNPTNGEVAMYVSTPQTAIGNIEVFDQFGQRVRSVQQTLEKGQSEIKLDLSAFRSGMYYAYIRVDDQMFTKKIIVAN